MCSDGYIHRNALGNIGTPFAFGTVLLCAIQMFVQQDKYTRSATGLIQSYNNFRRALHWVVYRWYHSWLRLLLVVDPHSIIVAENYCRTAHKQTTLNYYSRKPQGVQRTAAWHVNPPSGIEHSDS